MHEVRLSPWSESLNVISFHEIVGCSLQVLNPIHGSILIFFPSYQSVTVDGGFPDGSTGSSSVYIHYRSWIHSTNTPAPGFRG